MQGLLKLNEIAFNNLKYKDWDNVLIIDGDVGKGKSNLGLHAIDNWYSRLYENVTADLIKHVSLDQEQFITDLRDLKRCEMIIYDEAGDLSNLRQMDKFNHRITLSYQVIRGLNLYTILILPNIFRLNPYFTIDRARWYIHVYERGKYAFWDRERLRNMITINSFKKVKNRFLVKPLFHDHFPIYEGILKKPYAEKKNKKMDTIRDKLLLELKKEHKKDTELMKLVRAKEKIGVKATAEIWGVSQQAIYERLRNNADLIARLKS